MRLGVVLVAISVVGCLARAANERFELRVQEIESDYQKSIDRIESEYATSYDRIMKVKAGALIPTIPKNKTVPSRSVFERDELKKLESKCMWFARIIDELVSLRSDTSEAEAAHQTCLKLWNETRARVLVTTYWAADLDWVLETMNLDPETIQIEPLFVYSHNLRIRAYVEQRVRELNQARMVARRELDDGRARAVGRADAQRQAEIAESRRRFAIAMAALAEGYQRAQQAQSHQTHRSPVALSENKPRVCSSDFSCGMGFRCVKDNFASAGFCARAVNEFGLQTFELPDMNSVLLKLPSDSDCKFVTDCPIGFRCDVSSGVCLR
jgi:hypothetical protein